MSKIYCSLEKNVLHRLYNLCGESYYNNRYNFPKLINDNIEVKEVVEYKRKMSENGNNLYLAECCGLLILEKFFDIKEFNEEKYAEILNMNIPDLYDKMVLGYKRLQVKKKLDEIKTDFV